MQSFTKLTLALGAAMVLLAACETTEGLGRDTQKLGNDITGAAQKHDLDNNPKQ